MYSLGIIKLKTIILSFLFLTSLLHGASLGERMSSLPDKAERLFKQSEKLLGSPVTLDMVRGLQQIATGLLEDAIALEMHRDNSLSHDQVRFKILRDMEGAGNVIFFERHAEGFGGTITRILENEAKLDYLKNRIAFNVTRILEKDEAGLRLWHKRWNKAFE
jgi:hypothetical protein